LEIAEPRPDWRTDWLYGLVLRNAERWWEWCSRVPDRKVWRYVLIEEWSSAKDSMCRGKVVRSWIRDAEGLREISLEEYKQHKRKIHRRIYPFIIMEFHIQPNRKHVVLGNRQASTAGRGSRYLVEGEGDQAELIPDPTGSSWVS
jgi:hypothetical protein